MGKLLRIHYAFGQHILESDNDYWTYKALGKKYPVKAKKYDRLYESEFVTILDYVNENSESTGKYVLQSKTFL